jgi:hypothetical protein
MYSSMDFNLGCGLGYFFAIDSQWKLHQIICGKIIPIQLPNDCINKFLDLLCVESIEVINKWSRVIFAHSET